MFRAMTGKESMHREGENSKLTILIRNAKGLQVFKTSHYSWMSSIGTYQSDLEIHTSIFLKKVSITHCNDMFKGDFACLSGSPKSLSSEVNEAAVISIAAGSD